MSDSFATRLAAVDLACDVAIAAANQVHEQYRKAKVLSDVVADRLRDLREALSDCECGPAEASAINAVLLKAEKVPAAMQGEP